MDAQKVDLFVMTNQKYFPAEKIIYLKDKLLQTDESKFNLVASTELKDPTTILLVSIFSVRSVSIGSCLVKREWVF